MLLDDSVTRTMRSFDATYITAEICTNATRLISDLELCHHPSKCSAAAALAS